MRIYLFAQLAKGVAQLSEEKSRGRSDKTKPRQWSVRERL